jgi:hypothetical protein
MLDASQILIHIRVACDLQYVTIHKNILSFNKHYNLLLKKRVGQHRTQNQVGLVALKTAQTPEYMRYKTDS